MRNKIITILITLVMSSGCGKSGSRETCAPAFAAMNDKIKSFIVYKTTESQVKATLANSELSYSNTVSTYSKYIYSINDSEGKYCGSYSVSINPQGVLSSSQISKEIF